MTSKEHDSVHEPVCSLKLLTKPVSMLALVSTLFLAKNLTFPPRQIGTKCASFLQEHEVK